MSTATGAPDLVSLVRAHLTVGATVTSVAERLGMPADLVAAAIDALIGGGVVGGSCGPACGLPRADRPPSCAGCPLVR